MISSIPGLLLSAGLFAALIITLVLRQRLRMAALFAALGLGILFVTQLSDVLFGAIALPWLVNQRMDIPDLNTIFMIRGFVWFIFHALGLGLLITAVFVGRQPAAPVPVSQPLHQPSNPWGVR